LGEKQHVQFRQYSFVAKGKSPPQKAKDLGKKKGILDRHPGVQMAESSRLPRRLALGEESELPLLPLGVYLNGPLGGCGIVVLILRHCVSPPRKATIGGIVCIEDDYYG
jgi:hypothetical protein